MASVEPTPPAYDLAAEEQAICQKDEVNTDIKPGKFKTHFFTPFVTYMIVKPGKRVVLGTSGLVKSLLSRVFKLMLGAQPLIG